VGAAFAATRPPPPPAAYVTIHCVEHPSSPGSARSSRVRIALAGVAALVVAIPIAAGVLISGGSSTPQATASSTFKAVPVTHAQSRRSGPAGHGALVALVTHATPLRVAPAGHRLALLPNHTEFGSPEALWVVRQSGPWLGVVSPLAGNGRVGWIARSAATLNRVTWEIQVSLSSRRLAVLDSGKVVRRYTIAVGAPGSPTPTGRFAVTDRLLTGNPSGPYGCCIVALSARSPHAIQGWAGGNRIAIHSTPETSSIGHPVSHGCMRLTLAEGRWLLDHVPLGTPTIIRA
jgi:lipoprotein-anchoring transpeptidase ErfK/SrfK